MKIKTSLILITIVSVICDTMVLPFYPRFFLERFAVDDPLHTGLYIATSCVTVMLMFPLWARVAKRVNELHLWVYTQIASAVLGLSCFYTQDLLLFWLLSQIMLAFKASYLLIYPYVMRLESQDKHLNMASLFSVLMHFGAIGGALLGGAIMQWFAARYLYLIMMMGDLLQVAVCVYLIRAYAIKSAGANERSSSIGIPSIGAWPRYVWALGLLSLIFYLAAFTIRPFLVLYWSRIAGVDDQIIAGFMYSIPGWVALLGLYVSYRHKGSLNGYQRIFLSLFICILGCFMQASEAPAWFIFGRIIFAWGLFQITVNLEVVLFELSKPERFAADYSRVHIFQNIGVIAASFISASLFSTRAASWTFYTAAGAFCLTLILLVGFYRDKILSDLPRHWKFLGIRS